MNNKEFIERNYLDAVKGIKGEWFESVNSQFTEWYKYTVSLPPNLQTTYLIVLFHNQILNGGFDQYFVNGYGQFVRETIMALNKIKAIKKAELLENVFKIVNAENIPDPIFRKRLLEKDIKQLFSDQNISDSLDKLDNEYYSLESEENIELLLANYLKQC